MLKVSWDVEELVALIDVHRRSKDKTIEEIDKELSQLSLIFNKRAEMLSIVHDEKYRNLNGMRMMFQNVVYIATNKQQGLSSTSNSMCKVYEMMTTAPDVFELILNEFTKRYK